MTKEEYDKIIDFVNSDDYMLLNSYISKPYEETIIEQEEETERLNNIITEARDLLKSTDSWFKQFKKKQLEILDKENK